MRLATGMYMLLTFGIFTCFCDYKTICVVYGWCIVDAAEETQPAVSLRVCMYGGIRRSLLRLRVTRVRWACNF